MDEMALTKYADVEASKVLSPEEHKEIEANLRKVGKRSARDLTDEQREKIYAIRGKYQEQMAPLRKQLEELQAKELAACEGVLTDAQKRLLESQRAAAEIHLGEAGGDQRDRGRDPAGAGGRERGGGAVDPHRRGPGGAERDRLTVSRRSPRSPRR